MAIFSFSKDAVIDYVPSYGGNRESKEPCIVGIRFTSHSRVQEYSRLIAARSKSINEDPERKLEVSHEVQRKQFVENIAHVRGFIVGGNEITTAADLYDHAAVALIYELLAAMQDSATLSEGQRKNSQPDSAGD